MTRRTWLLAVAYIGFSGLAFSGGFLWSYLERPPAVDIAAVPASPPQLHHRVHLFENPNQYLVSSAGAALITEPGIEEGSSTRYWCARSADEWGEVIYRFPLSETDSRELAILDVNLCTFPAFDKDTFAELWVTSDAVRDRWTRLVQLGPGTADRMMRDPLDVSPWTRGATRLEVKYRIRAHRLQYYPDPNSPTGFAGSQCLRHMQRDMSGIALRLW
jgi:hypothetical protein